MSDSERITEYDSSEIRTAYDISVLSIEMIENARKFLMTSQIFGPLVDYPVFNTGDESEGIGDA